MKIVSGTFNGTGAAVYLCLGFIPDEFTLWAVDDQDANVISTLYWNKQFRALVSSSGILIPGGTTWEDLEGVTGVVPYSGADILTATSAGTVTYGNGVYLKKDPKGNYQADTDYGVVGAIDTWTLDTSANRTGHFNEDLLDTSATGRIGEGSRVLIEVGNRQYWATILAGGNTAGVAGGASDEVTLSRVIPSGTVRYIGPMFDYLPMITGEVTLEGVYVGRYTNVNVNDELQAFKAVLWD